MKTKFAIRLIRVDSNGAELSSTKPTPWADIPRGWKPMYVEVYTKRKDGNVYIEPLLPIGKIITAGSKDK